jgi:hypothetical protein
MRILASVKNAICEISKKQVVVAGAFAIALAASVGMGLAVKSSVSAASSRDCTRNSIDYKNRNGGCGALTPAEYIADLRQNDPADLQIIAGNFHKDFHLTGWEYDSFVKNARSGLAYRDGHVEVDGQTVLTDSWSIGRDRKAKSWAYNISGSKTTYWASYANDVYRRGTKSIPVMVYFAEDGTVQYVVMKPCGNPVGGKKVTPYYGCRALNKDVVDGKKNTYDFNTDAYAGGNAKIARAVYNFDDGTAAETRNNPAEKVRHTFTKPGTYNIKVTVYINLPGGKVKTVDCVQQVTVVEPYAACDLLQATAVETRGKYRKYSFAVSATAKNGATIKNANFIYDGKKVSSVALTNVHEFNDYAAHQIVAEINFVIDGQIVTKTGPKCNVTLPAVEQPYATCDLLEAVPQSVVGKNRKYIFKVKGTAKNGAVIQSANFIYDKTTRVNGVKPDQLHQMANIHEYNDYNVHQVAAEINFEIDGKIVTKTSADCFISVESTPHPYATCDRLRAVVVNEQKRQYNFVVTGTAKNNVGIRGANFIYDGQKVASDSWTDSHTFNDYAAHKIVAEINFVVEGKIVVKTSPDCVVELPATNAPYATCDLLKTTVVDAGKRAYKFELSGTAKNGATIKGGTFEYDGLAVGGVTPVNGVMTDTHTFADKVGHNVIGKIVFVINGAEVVKTAADCATTIAPVDTPMCTVPGKGNLPANSPECYENCKVPGKENLPKNSPECVPPVLPNTGAGNVIGLFAGATVLGTVAHRVFSRRRQHQ